MKKYALHTHTQTMLSDTLTPVNMYLQLRDRYKNTFLLESSDYHVADKARSYICVDPISHFVAHEDEIEIQNIDGSTENFSYQKGELQTHLQSFVDRFDVAPNPKQYIHTGLFGYKCYEAVAHFEDIELKQELDAEKKTPICQYHLFRYVIAIDHFKNQCYFTETYTERPDTEKTNDVLRRIYMSSRVDLDFSTKGERTSCFSDAEYRDIVRKGIHHCKIGDVFQIVLSREFKQAYAGDDFQVYRALRSINPSPYLFYFDYGQFRLMGSSPEAQIEIYDHNATIYPIAGTFKRTGDDRADRKEAQRLRDDPKENAEHIMLVDLARNDLSRAGSGVHVETLKEIQFYSHVIHMVSKVSGRLHSDLHFLDMVGSTFPAGTLSGAPKHRAMQLIDRYEAVGRGYYGGAIGMMDFHQNYNHAIMIRTILSQNQTLVYQAGAGVVAQSDPESELQEVYNKVGALEAAIAKARDL